MGPCILCQIHVQAQIPSITQTGLAYSNPIRAGKSSISAPLVAGNNDRSFQLLAEAPNYGYHILMHSLHTIPSPLYSLPNMQCAFHHLIGSTATGLLRWSLRVIPGNFFSHTWYCYTDRRTMLLISLPWQYGHLLSWETAHSTISMECCSSSVPPPWKILLQGG